MTPDTARRTIGKYVLTEELGRGGMGIVWLARDPTLGRDIALKTLGDMATASTDAQRLRREALSVAQLKHPNIVQVYEVGDHQGRPYFTMEYVRGASLERAAADMDLQRKVAVARDIARALDYAHKRGVVHRDVKPGNVLIATDGRVVLMDFGLARNARDKSGLTVAGALLGTPRFMAPEQAFGDAADVSPRTDVFALGALLYFLLCDRGPFDRDDPVATLNAVLTVDPPAPHRVRPGVPRELGIVCEKALEKMPADRYPSAADLAADLERWLAGDAVLARPRTLLARVRRWVRRNRLVAMLALALAATSLAAAWGLSRDAPAPVVAPPEPPTVDEGALRRERARPFVDAGVRHMELAERCMMTGRGEDLRAALTAAVAQFTRALGADPESALALAGRGRAQRLAGDRDAAIADLDRAIALDPEAGIAWYERGLVRLARFHEAREVAAGGGPAALAAARALQLAAADDLAHAAAAHHDASHAWLPAHAHGALAFLAGEIARARAELDAALDVNPFLDDALTLRATLRLVAVPPDLQGALLDLDRAVQANALSATARNLRGIARTQADDLRGAREDHEAAVILDPHYAPALLNRGRIRIRLGDIDAGLADLRAFLERFPGHPRAAEVRAELEARQPR